MKDPAFLFYYRDFDSQVSEWEADAIGWYMRLLCSQAQHGDLPNDLELLAQIARVRHSQYDTFCTRYATRLASEFAIVEGNRLRNELLHQRIIDRKAFTLKKSVLASFANIIKNGDFSNKDAAFLKKEFNYKEFLIEDLKERNISLSEWVSVTLSVRNKANANANANKEVNKDEDLNKKSKSKILELTPKNLLEETFESEAAEFLQSEGFILNGWEERNALTDLGQNIRIKLAACLDKPPTVPEQVEAFKTFWQNLREWTRKNNLRLTWIVKNFNSEWEAAMEGADIERNAKDAKYMNFADHYTM